VKQLLLGSGAVDEECAAIAADTLAQLALMDAAEMVPWLQLRLGADDANTRRVVVAAARHLLNDPADSAKAALDGCAARALPATQRVRWQCSSRTLFRPAWSRSVKPGSTKQPANACCGVRRCASDFLATLGDADVGVRKEALLLVATALSARPALAHACLPTITSALLHLTQVDAALVTTIDLGPFKQKQDLGLALRKLAIDCLEACRVCYFSVSLLHLAVHSVQVLADGTEVCACRSCRARVLQARATERRRARPRVQHMLASPHFAEQLDSGAVLAAVAPALRDRGLDNDRDVYKACLSIVRRVAKVAPAALPRALTAAEPSLLPGLQRLVVLRPKEDAIPQEVRPRRLRRRLARALRRAGLRWCCVQPADQS
jgi:TATA-binding protein interacting (TIP20)